MDVRRGLAALLCVPLLGLASCTDDESSADPGDPTSSAAPSPTATPGAPQNAAYTPTSAKAFVVYWIDSFNFAAASGETDTLRSLATPDCASCADLADTIDEIYEPGGRITSEGWKPDRFRGAQLDKNDLAQVTVDIELSPQEIHPGDGGPVQKTSGGRGKAQFQLEWSGDYWHLAQLTQSPA